MNFEFTKGNAERLSDMWTISYAYATKMFPCDCQTVFYFKHQQNISQHSLNLKIRFKLLKSKVMGR